ncbi:sensor histidine kinase [Herbaspirillum sp. NPDC087042]|uniref:sensor histidine kinase n=1 Tax=Herbaspirillum sp. NPDC087042 TaxID=3364004 RepID=UPI00382672DB
MKQPSAAHHISPDDIAPPNALEQRIREIERARIARDLHDELGAQLTGLGMVLAQLRENLEKDRVTILAQTEYAQQLISQAHDSLHSVIDDLYPPVVEFGLPDALAWQCAAFNRQSGLACTFSPPLQHLPQSLGSDDFLTVSLLRILREALNNSLRHAVARHLRVDLLIDDQQLQLTIADDGQGFDPTTASGQGHGLRSMRQRAHLLGGQLQLDSVPGGPTVVRVTLPVAP